MNPRKQKACLGDNLPSVHVGKQFDISTFDFYCKLIVSNEGHPIGAVIKRTETLPGPDRDTDEKQFIFVNCDQIDFYKRRKQP